MESCLGVKAQQRQIDAEVGILAEVLGESAHGLNGSPATSSLRILYRQRPRPVQRQHHLDASRIGGAELEGSENLVGSYHRAASVILSSGRGGVKRYGEAGGQREGRGDRADPNLAGHLVSSWARK